MFAFIKSLKENIRQKVTYKRSLKIKGSGFSMVLPYFLSVISDRMVCGKALTQILSVKKM